MTTDERILQILADIAELKYRAGRLESDAISEKDTRADRNATFDTLILKIENDFKDVLYGENRRSGMVVELDRLNQIKKLVWGLIVVVTPVALKVVIDWLK